MITKEAIEAARSAIRYLNGPDTPWSDEQVSAVIAAALAAMPVPAVRVDRLRAILRELWAAYDMDLKMCDGTIKAGQCGTLRDIRDDLGHLLSTIALTPATDLASENERLPQDVVNLVIAAREFWDVAMDESDDSAALDCALEAFSSRVPYENDPEEIRAALERT